VSNAVTAQTVILVEKIMAAGLILTSCRALDGRAMVTLEDDYGKITAGLAASFDEAIKKAAQPWDVC
jgi:hypothetical protein